ncbi:MAG: Fe-S cluster assembly protein SufD [Acidobacteria bacterium]|nr:Fe-S cluster assembly protein SufD [Acidobacteriota bacterium]
MQKFRALGYDRAEAFDPPDVAEEHWRYSPIGKLDFSALEPYESDRPQLTGAHSADAFEERDALIVCADDEVVSVELSGDALAAGVVAGRLVDHLEVESIVASLPQPDDHLSAMNQAWSSQPLVIDVPANAVMERPLVVASRAGEGSGISFPRTIVRVGENAQVTVIDHQRGGHDRQIAPLIDLLVGRGANVRYMTYQDLVASAWQLARLRVSVDADANVGVFAVALGGSYARLQIDCALIGRGSHVRVAAVYVSGDHQVHDFRTSQHHIAEDTSSDLLFKGVVDDDAQAIYTGLIHVGPDARGANALQTNRTITLSEGASAESVPNLEIENNEVRCSHASAVGPIDRDQVFYLESRGVPTARAERLIIEGFIDAVISEFPAGQETVRAEVAARFTGEDDE